VTARSTGGPARGSTASVFTRLLDPDAGHFSIRAPDAGRVTRRYVEGSLVQQTDHETEHGTLRVTDALAFEPGATGHGIGHRSPQALVRVAEAIGGEVTLELEYVPRQEYGLVVPRLEIVDGVVCTVGGPERLYLTGIGADLQIDGRRGFATVTLREGEVLGLTLHRAPGPFGPPPPLLEAVAALESTLSGWRTWGAGHEDFVGPYADLVDHSAAVLQGCTYQPTGAVVAAATTSIPEREGGAQNWDYRFAWLRDGSLLAQALLGATCADEAERYFRWMTHAAVSCPSAQHVQIVFGAGGERFLEERQLTHLRGFADSRPVRIGNAAWRQQQLDVLGEVLDVAVALDEGPGLELDDNTAAFLCQFADRAAEHWRQPDAGMWEERDRRRHHTISKALCWVALDRAVRLADQLGDEAHPDDWARARDAIRTRSCTRRGTRTSTRSPASWGGDELDAAVLLLPLFGFLDAGDPRMRATVAALEESDLMRDGLLWRIGRLPDQGAFVPACFWLAANHALAGDVATARARFERAAATANDVGLLAEVFDPDRGVLLGGLPQVLSHVGLITAARCIAEAEEEGR
jgi:GH15 family glucan-1,4-alpha-glucosidase